MKTFELFEQEDDYGFIYFELNRDEVGWEAGRIARDVAKRIGAEVTKVQKAPTYHYGEHTFRPIEVIIRVPLSGQSHPSYRVSIQASRQEWIKKAESFARQASQHEWIKKAEKALRRLSRGKPRFHVPQVTPYGLVGGQ